MKIIRCHFRSGQGNGQRPRQRPEARTEAEAKPDDGFLNY